MIPTPREQIKGMAPAEAVEQLLHTVEALTGTPEEIQVNIGKRRLTPALAKIYTALQKAGDKGISYDGLMLLASKGYDEGTTRGCLSAQMTYLRRYLVPVGDERIENIWGWGYRLVKK